MVTNIVIMLPSKTDIRCQEEIDDRMLTMMKMMKMIYIDSTMLLPLYHQVKTDHSNALRWILWVNFIHINHACRNRRHTSHKYNPFDIY